MTPDPKAEAFLHGLAVLSALGEGRAETLANLRAGRAPGMRWRAGYAAQGAPAMLGGWDGPLPDPASLPLAERSRNNLLGLKALPQLQAELDAARRDFAPGRLGVVLGSSTSGVAEAEAAFKARPAGAPLPESFHYSQQELGSPAACLARSLGFQGPALVISTACSSSAKALATARRLLRLGVCDAVLAGGVDTLCGFTVQGFQALGALSLQPTLPFSAHRQGINIGEAAAFFVVRREPSALRLAGFGESSDAYNVSAPHPEGRGAATALRGALADADLGAAQVDYLNLHGTGTLQNDAMESLAVKAVFPEGVPCGSTKPLSGHCLGAAGAVEAAIAAALLLDADSQGRLPAHVWDSAPDPALPALDLIGPGRALGRPLRRILSSSFGFGGSNAALLLERL
jgi:3-oxoacyl-[acyl-carrier-protein] synthase-1